jgi:hypothetical protein
LDGFPAPLPVVENMLYMCRSGGTASVDVVGKWI